MGLTIKVTREYNKISVVKGKTGKIFGAKMRARMGIFGGFWRVLWESVTSAESAPAVLANCRRIAGGYARGRAFCGSHTGSCNTVLSRISPTNSTRKFFARAAVASTYAKPRDFLV